MVGDAISEPFERLLDPFDHVDGNSSHLKGYCQVGDAIDVMTQDIPFVVSVVV